MFGKRTTYNATGPSPTNASSEIHSSIAFSVVPMLHFAVMVLGLIVNVCMINLGLRLCRPPKARSRCDYFFVVVGLCDIGTLSATPLWVMQNMAKEWIFGYVVCKATKGVITFCLQYGVLMMVCISVERYNRVVLRKAAFSSLKRVKGEWARRAFLSLVCAIPPSVSALVNISNHETFKVGLITLCADTYSPSERFVITWIRMTICFIAPCIILAACYGAIFFTVRRHVRRGSAHLKREQLPLAKSYILSLLTVIVFVCCWTPWIAVSIYYSLTKTLVHNQLKLFLVTNVSLAARNMQCITTPALYLSMRTPQSVRRIGSTSTKSGSNT
uniref:Chemokine receptor CXCR-like n=1 Tax=Oryzias latipes TaxID=8090 RepID=A0A286P9V9_ORYLA|nr:chemokine receptor CXCR-like [Oryzias latipes]